MTMSIRPMGDANSTQFQFTPGVWVFHPQLGYQAQLSAGVVVVFGPFQAKAAYGLGQVPLQRWVDLQDNGGRQMPLAINVVDEEVVYGRWTVAPGVAARERSPMELFVKQLFPG